VRSQQRDEAQRQLAAEREGRARAEAAALQATDSAQAAEVLHPALRETLDALLG